MRVRLIAAALAVLAAGPARAAETAPGPAPTAAATAQPALEAGAVDGLRACQSIVDGRAPADAAAIFGFTAAGETLLRETDRGKIEILPPAGDRRSCRVQVYALVLENKDVLDAVSAFLTTPPQAYAPLQSRIAERVGNYAARTSIWAQSGGGEGLAMVTLYEILANEYYLGPKIIVDFLVDKT